MHIYKVKIRQSFEDKGADPDVRYRKADIEEYFGSMKGVISLLRRFEDYNADNEAEDRTILSIVITPLILQE